jgi:hypothetical protein
MPALGRSRNSVFSSLQERLIQDVMAQQAMYDRLERSIGGPVMVDALRLHHQMSKIAEENKRVELAVIRDAQALTCGRAFAHEALEIAKEHRFAKQTREVFEAVSGGEALCRAAKRMEQEAGVEALWRTVGGLSSHFALAQLQKQASEVERFRDLSRGMTDLEGAFAAAVTRVSASLPVETLWLNVSAVTQPWILVDDPYRSFEAFGALSEIAQSTARLRAFEGKFATGLELPVPSFPDDLAAYKVLAPDDETEVDPRIDDLPVFAFGTLARAAGLTIHRVDTRVNSRAHKDLGILLVGTGSWATEAHGQVQAVEVMLRAQLDARMTALLGSNWYKQRVNKAVLAAWRSKQVEARVGCSESVLDFATFGELRDVLLRADVWDVGFAADVKMTKEEFTVCLDRLMEIRHAVDHCRKLNRRHFVWSFSEVDRILQAFGIEAIAQN